MAERKPSEIAELLGDIAQLVQSGPYVAIAATAIATAARLVVQHHRYWVEQQDQSNAPIDNPGETWDELVAAKDRVARITGGRGTAVDLLNALQSVARASTMLAGDLPGDRQTDPPPPTE